jgi:hypothetical protein
VAKVCISKIDISACIFVDADVCSNAKQRSVNGWMLCKKVSVFVWLFLFVESIHSPDLLA